MIKCLGFVLKYLRLKNKKRVDERDNFKMTKWSLMKYRKLLYYFCYFCALLKISITKKLFQKTWIIYANEISYYTEKVAERFSGQREGRELQIAPSSSPFPRKPPEMSP